MNNVRNQTNNFLRPAAIAAGLVIGTLFSVPALAYVGPGAGISVLGALWGLIVGVVVAVGVILFWPIKMMIRKSKAKKAAAAGAAEETAVADTAAEPAQSDSTTS
jgi:hypothetical protein